MERGRGHGRAGRPIGGTHFPVLDKREDGDENAPVKKLRTHIEIEAPPSAVWKVMSDLARWPEWTEVFETMSAEPRIGSRVSFRIHLGKLPVLPIQAKMREWEPDRAIAWGAGVNGIFTGHHFFHLEPIGENQTRLTHGEDFTGIIPPLTLWGPLLGTLMGTYQKLNRDLRDRVERDHHAKQATR